MPRPLRFVPERALVEITARTFQGRLLLRPSPDLTDIILGIIAKAQDLYGMTIHAFVFLSTHAHFLLSPTSVGQLALFMQFVNANVAKDPLVEHVWEWPGVNSYDATINGTALVASRPAHFFRKNGNMPEAVELRLSRPDGFESMPHEEFAGMIKNDPHRTSPCPGLLPAKEACEINVGQGSAGKSTSVR